MSALHTYFACKKNNTKWTTCISIKRSDHSFFNALTCLLNYHHHHFYFFMINYMTDFQLFFLSGYTLTYLRYVHMYVIHIKYITQIPIHPQFHHHHTSRLDRFFLTVWSPQLKSPVKRTSRERMEREKKYDFHPHLLHHHQNIIVSWDTRFKKNNNLFFLSILLFSEEIFKTFSSSSLSFFFATQFRVEWQCVCVNVLFQVGFFIL